MTAGEINRFSANRHNDRLDKILQRFARISLPRPVNVAIIFAFASIPVIGFIGAGHDYSHANAVKADMQAALDSSALMPAKDAATLSQDHLQLKASNYFLALFTRPEATLNSLSATYTAEGGAAVTVSGSVDVPTTEDLSRRLQKIPTTGTRKPSSCFRMD
jgi:hypothetical protein